MSEELSKSQQKKLAKKAEKAAKKQAAKEGDVPPTPAAATAAKPAAAKAAAPVLAPKLKLVNAQLHCTATLKAVYASRVFGVALQAGTRKDAPDTGNKPALVRGDDLVLGGGGNAMVQALSLLGGRAPDFEADDWCEWERTTLRHATSKSLGKALDHLAATLETGHGLHLVGDDGDSMADVVLVSTLSTFVDSLDTWPRSVQVYYQAHQAGLRKAQSSVPAFVPPPPVAMDDPSLMKVLTQVFLDAFDAVVPDAQVPSTLVSKCANAKHGDFQCSGAMPAFASIKSSSNSAYSSPPQFAQAIVQHLQQSPAASSVLTDLQIQGPGFILCRISSDYLQTQVARLVATQSLFKPQISSPQICVVDFSSPNIAKEMHVGHLRSTIIGEAVCRVLEFVGHDVARVNHVGDWGTQFGMLIQYLKEEYPNFSQELPNITDLTAFYKAAKERFDESADFKKTAQLNVVDLQSGDEECLKIWKILCEISRHEFQKVYDRLDVTVVECGESFYNDKIPPVLQEFEEAGKISVEEGGAKCVFVDSHKIPLMLQKSDGGFGYDSTDMAALKYRLHTLKAQRIIVITDFSQGDHFAMCNQAARDIGWVEDGQILQHIGFGTVMGDDGKRFKTRSGDTVRLVDLLDEAVNRMESSLKERKQQGKTDISEDDLHKTAEAIGYGAVKYFDLRRNPTGNYKFSYDAMLDTKGNTAVYLMYARVRFESIMVKAKEEHGVDVEVLIKNKEPVSLDHPSERNLALQLQTFTDTIELTLDDLFPYHICDYLYNLSIAAADFVTQCRVLGSPEMNSRLMLCYVVSIAMDQCFDLLGIRHVKKI